MLRPDPLLIANMIEAYKQEHTYKGQPVTEEVKENKRGITVGAIVMILTQIVMVAIMTMTPVHMGHHGHDLSAVGLVIGFHVGAMYLPSLVTGMLIDKIGRTTMSIAGGVILLAAGVIAAIAPSDSLILLIVALSLLGLGWNLGLISGTAQIVDATILPHVQNTRENRCVYCASWSFRWSDVRNGSGEFKLCDIVISWRSFSFHVDSCCDMVSKRRN